MAKKRIKMGPHCDSSKYVVIKVKDWERLLDALQSSAGLRAACDDFCEEECAGETGCRFGFGSAGSCGAVCNNRSIILQV